MFIKKNPNSDKLYTYYRLMHTYKAGGKVRQQIIINLGKLEDVAKKAVYINRKVYHFN